jgi:hypothetical protein
VVSEATCKIYKNLSYFSRIFDDFFRPVAARSGEGALPLKANADQAPLTISQRRTITSPGSITSSR